MLRYTSPRVLYKTDIRFLPFLFFFFRSKMFKCILHIYLFLQRYPLYSFLLLGYNAKNNDKNYIFINNSTRHIAANNQEKNASSINQLAKHLLHRLCNNTTFYLINLISIRTRVIVDSARSFSFDV